ncbi:hypothetical protein [Streptomyces sp. enrichment culture]|uniref:hypothetical protein n=1 Tax=Streptomyces sp. enrichment culture TaxID=1795815 RepID=UPI003F576DDF
MNTRTDALATATEAAFQAEELARRTESAARSIDNRHQTEPLARAGALWADVARAYAAIAAALPADDAGER